MKKMFLFITIVSLCSCVSKQRENELLDVISDFEIKLDDCQNGADKLYAKMILNYENGDFFSCKEIFNAMQNKHPDSKLFVDVKSMYDKVLKDERDKADRERILAEKEAEEKRKKIEEKRKKRLEALKKLKKEKDDVSGITWYKQPYFTHYTNTNLTSIYIGSGEYSPWLRLKMSYQGDSWIFFKKAYLSYDGNTKEIIFNEYDDKKSDNDSGVWEWIDIKVTKDVEDFLREFSKSKNAKMRLSGKYTKTRNLSWKERQGIRDVLNGYDALKDERK
jgi:hypothetical protein